MSKTVAFILSIWILSSCHEVKKHEIRSTKETARNTTAKVYRPRYRNLASVIETRQTLRYWASKESYYPTLHFDNVDTLWIEFNGQCEYNFPYKLQNRKIVVYWDDLEDCTHAVDIKKSFALKSRPTAGEPFMTLELTDDTTLHANYLFKEWADSVNKQYSGYEYFPKVFLSCGE